MDDDIGYGVFSSFNGEGSYRLVNTIVENVEHGDVSGNVDVIFANRSDTYLAERFDELAQEYEEDDLFDPATFDDIVTLESRDYRRDLWDDDRDAWRETYDREVMDALDAYDVDVGVLAGYKLIIGEEMCDAYDMINLHPAPPGGPEGVWQDVIREQVENDQPAGAQMHLVIPDVDEGQAVTYFAFDPADVVDDEIYDAAQNGDVDAIETAAEAVREYEFAREIPLVIETLDQFGTGTLAIRSDDDGKQVYRGGNPVDTAMDLTDQVDQRVTEDDS